MEETVEGPCISKVKDRENKSELYTNGLFFDSSLSRLKNAAGWGKARQGGGHLMKYRQGEIHQRSLLAKSRYL